MISSIKENRIQNDGLYVVTLKMPEGEYFNLYDDVRKGAAEEILNNYLSYRGDDGKPDNVSIRHDKNGHTVDIISELHYLGNNHTEGRPVPDVLNITRDNVNHR